MGSIFYLQSEELELQRSKSEDEEKKAFHNNLARESISNSSECFNVILNVVDKLPGRARREANVAEVHALSIYGLGVIALHTGKYDEASELLRESRLRAKGCEFGELVNSAELELKKLDKAREELKAKKESTSGNEEQSSAAPAITLAPPTMDVLLLKNQNLPEGDSKPEPKPK